MFTALLNVFRIDWAAYIGWAYLVQQLYEGMEDINLDTFFPLLEARNQEGADFWVQRAQQIRVAVDDCHQALGCRTAHFPARVIVIREVIV